MKVSTKSKINKLVFLCAFTYFISYITRKNFSTIIVAVSSGTGVSQSNLGLALTGTFITYGIGQLISGFLGDRFQPKKLVALGLLVTIIANICLSLCGANYVLMTVLWCINGFAQAFMWPPIVKLMTDRLSDEEYKKQTQKISWGSTFATIFLYLACPLIISLLNWESVFYFSAIIGIVGLIYWWVSCPIIELKREEKVEVSSNNKIKIRNYLWLLLPIMFAIVLQGILRDGVTDWMPSYIKETYSLSDEISILTGVILPIFAMFSYAVATWAYTKKLKNPLLCSGVIFGVGAICSIVLYLFPSVSPVLSVSMSGIITACMHGVNLLLICILPAFFKKWGNVSMISGLLNCCTYIGSALSAYVIPLIAEGAGGWSMNLLVWAILAVVGTVVCILTVPSWAKFEKNTKTE